MARETTSDRYIWWAVASDDGKFLAVSNWRGQVGDDKATHLFDLQTGVTVAAFDGQQLSPTALSSGEKQLLLLCCNTLVARGRSSLFLIDEPELSLNIKWQRRLVESLLGLAVNRNVQFIFATHSFELLAPHEKSVLELKNIEDHQTSGHSKKNTSRTRSHSQA